MKIRNGKTWTLTSAVFPTMGDALKVRGRVNADEFCGYAPGQFYVSSVAAEQGEGGWRITNFKFQTPVTDDFPTMPMTPIFNPQEVAGAGT